MVSIHGPELIGQRFGFLVVQSLSHKDASRRQVWGCVCDCGRKSSVATAQLRNGTVRSCGHDIHRRKHGHTLKGMRSPTFKSWEGMKQRCQNPKDPSYSSYGGRGITVCDRWQKFANFLADMGDRPDETSIDRIDVDGNYEPGNCRWASRSEQQRNSRKARKFTANGMTLSIQEWAARLDTSPQAITNRMKKGMTAEDAVTTPIRRVARRKGKQNGLRTY